MKHLLLAMWVTVNCHAAVSISQVEESNPANILAHMENEHLKISFIGAKRDGKITARPVMDVRKEDQWVHAPLDESAESYQIVSAPESVTYKLPHRVFHPRWTDTENDTLRNAQVIWEAGENREAIVASATQLDAQRVRLNFHPLAEGTLEAVWTLKPGEKSVKVSLEFRPSKKGQYALGYFLFNRKPMEVVDELLLPMTVQGKRFPSKPYTYMQTQSPTPMSLMQVGSMTWTVAGDPESMPFEFPVPAKSRYGLQIRSPEGLLHPSIYGPLIGMPDSLGGPTDPVQFSFRVLVQPGDWYAAYRTVADEIFGLHDYRKNTESSMTEAALNMIDLYMDDQYSGWWKRAKAPHQVESKNGSTQATPLTALSLYRLTGDREIYRRRTLPTLEFMLSRDGPHFSPIPEDTGGYAAGSMKGPVNIYGATVFAGLWEMMNRRTSAFREIAFPNDGMRLTQTQQNFETHNQPFDELLGKYLFTGDQATLEQAVVEADKYIAQAITQRPTREIRSQGFFLMVFTPAWEGLLRLYEVTNEKRFLDAAEYGARMVMTGMWTQPTSMDSQVTIHPDGTCHGDKMHMVLHKGSEKFRLGWPLQPGDTPEKEAPSWLVSNVGMGFEQPSTYTYMENGGRMIFQAPWTPRFLRLAHYTGDKQFETYARNAVVGRWNNYPGYYYTTFTDLMQNSRYPYEGPDMSFIYYHHILVHLSWTLDYLVSEAFLRSAGKIQFPALRQFGYAYFDNLVYGHAPGEIMGEKGAWLWIRRDLIALDNPQVNYLTAHNSNSFYVVLTNANREPEKVKLTFLPQNIDPEAKEFRKVRFLKGGKRQVQLSNNAIEINLGPRELVVLAVDGLRIDIPAHRVFREPGPAQKRGTAKVAVDGDMEVRAAAIQIEPGPWDAYIWSTAGSRELRQISLNWIAGDQRGTLSEEDYPYEFSVPVPQGVTQLSFTTNGIKADGARFETEVITIGVSP